MTVKELIEELRKEDPNADVVRLPQANEGTKHEVIDITRLGRAWEEEVLID